VPVFRQVIVNTANKFLQSMAQFPFRNAILKLRVEKIPKRASRRAFFLLQYKPPMTKPPATAATDLPELRRQIIELVAQNAVPMVQQAIDAVREGGQYQAIKFLFEMIGLYPASADENSPVEDSLARTLLDHLGLPNSATSDDSEQEN
jgi:hypothetical protein